MQYNKNSNVGKRLNATFGNFDAAVKTTGSTDDDMMKALLWIGFGLDRIATSIEYVVNKQRVSDKVRKETTEKLKDAIQNNLPNFVQQMQEALAKVQENIQSEDGDDDAGAEVYRLPDQSNQ